MGGKTTVLAVTMAGVLMTPRAEAQECCCGSTSPLVLDLEGDGFLTTSLMWPVVFDIDGDGVLEWSAWTTPYGEDGLLWLDRDHDGVADSGGELFGSATPLPEGGVACNGFEALAVFDRMEEGGDADGQIDPGDEIWGRLQVWVDRDHDAQVDGEEAVHLSHLGIQSISLDYEESDEVDGNMNRHRYQSFYMQRLRHRGRVLTRTLAIHDIYFQTGLTTPPGPP